MIRICLKMWYSPPTYGHYDGESHHQPSSLEVPFIGQTQLAGTKMKNGGEWWRSTSKFIKHIKHTENVKEDPMVNVL